MRDRRPRVASGGVDFDAAKNGITAILAPGLPGLVAPRTAGEILSSGSEARGRSPRVVRVRPTMTAASSASVKKPHVVVMGAGWAGCAAAVAAASAGARVLLERTDMILGTGLVGGIMRNNGRLTAAEELRDGRELCLRPLSRASFTTTCVSRARHASLYDVTCIEPAEFLRFLRHMRSTCMMSTCTGLAGDGARRICEAPNWSGHSWRCFC